jgi:hypothetical protein
MITYAPVAQLDRVLVSEAKGRGFDSRRARQINLQPKQPVMINQQSRK